MKRFLLILLAAMLVFLGGCSGDEEEGPAATPTPSPVPSPTPVARLSAAQYSYVEYRNNVIRLKFLVPSHWEQRDGTNIVSFHEPVNSGEIDSMVSLAVKTFSREVNQETYLAECNTYMQYIAQQFAEDFTYTDFAEGDTLVDRPAMCSTYSGTMSGVPVQGYVAIVSNGARLYAFHFRCEASRYNDLSSVLTYIRSSFEAISVI